VEAAHWRAGFARRAGDHTSHGDTAFTVPMFDEFMKRIMPGEAWR